MCNGQPTYEVIGRYTSGRKTTAYQVRDLNTQVESVSTREEFIELCQQRKVYGVVTTSLVNPDDVLDPTTILRGKAVRLAELPIYDIRTGKPKQVGAVKSGAPTVPKYGQAPYTLVARLAHGRLTVGFEVKDIQTGEVKRYRKPAVVKLIQAHKIANVRLQSYRGELLIRGTKTNLMHLPTIQVDSHGREVAATPRAETPAIAGDSSEKQVEATDSKQSDGGDSTTKSLRKHSPNKITAKLVCGRQTVGYKLTTEMGEYTINKADAMQFIRDGKVSNARVQLNRGTPLIRGVDCNFNNLPCIQVKETHIESDINVSGLGDDMGNGGDSKGLEPLIDPASISDELIPLD